MMLPFEAEAQTLGGMLFVWLNHEHANAGGSPYFTVLHRILGGGVVKWSRMVDGRGRAPALRLHGDVLLVDSGWHESPFAAPPFSIRGLCVATGEEVEP